MKDETEIEITAEKFQALQTKYYARRILQREI
jgi:hypothetical protein